MKTTKIYLFIAGLLFMHTFVSAQSLQDTIEIKKTAMRYISSWIEGDSAKMRTALHPMLHKQDTKGGLATVDELCEVTSRCYGCHSSTFYANVQILDIEMDSEQDMLIASVFIDSESFVDYLTISKTYGKYLITHVLWEFKLDKRAGEDAGALLAVKKYQEALNTKNYEAFADAVAPTFCSGQPKCYFVVENTNKEWYERNLENYNYPFLPDGSKTVEVLSIYNGTLAVVKAKQGKNAEYFYLFFNNGWQIASTTRNFYVPLREIYACSSTVSSSALAQSCVAVFDTRLHYNEDIEYFEIVSQSKEKVFAIEGKDKLIITKESSSVKSWPQKITVKAKSSFGDFIEQEFVFNLAQNGCRNQH